jgi:hypothetical protein
MFSSVYFLFYFDQMPARLSRSDGELTMTIRRGGALCVIMNILSWTFHVYILAFILAIPKCFGTSYVIRHKILIAFVKLAQKFYGSFQITNLVLR